VQVSKVEVFACITCRVQVDVFTCIMCRVQVEVKNVMKSWSDLYANFVRLSAMVANTEPNVACEQLLSDVLTFIDQLSTTVC